MRILLTGSAGFIGFHLARRLIADGHEVFGVDGMTAYYDVALKTARHDLLKRHNGFSEHIVMLEDRAALETVAEQARPEAIIHLAAQAGVRYSLEHPETYVDSNLVGTFNVMELARKYQVGHFLGASTSSVYGANTVMPFCETDRADHPMTFYAATKKATELMTHSYSHLWDIPTTMFRFFTVYGPWGRPDMALFKFVDATLKGRPIDVYNGGDMKRDFTYVDDLVEGIVRLLTVPPVKGSPVGPMDSLSPAAPWRAVNIGRGEPVNLMDFIREMEGALGREATLNMMPMQAGDVPATFASVDLLTALTGYTPGTSVHEGVAAFVAWYRAHYGVS
ncbi:MAG: NAD-dependent epimerase/dehydratase family protein [Brevundimonas sp.]|uniref:NAD-dependent epimerase/dehydratase family protein n=1 Tax=Brevundimonas sp. TaxID=1871086 RepID=UPI001222D1C5|nr:NAD-dependent epimerase/dehydratase family protein [Brevundimonas sp.]RZJ19068.1 MAG: NAD-dependent epimerase/dehydratase family protein [Brevundimonas sp.]